VVALESVFAPDLSRLRDGVVQSSLVEDLGLLQRLVRFRQSRERSK